MKTSSTRSCHICAVVFTLTNSKKICNSCSLPVCKNHVKNIGNICDFCYKEELVNNYQFSNKELKEKLDAELKGISKENQNTAEVLEEQENRVKHLQGCLSAIAEKIKSLKVGYEEKIEKEGKRNESFYRNFENLKKSDDELVRAEELLKKNVERFELEEIEIRNRTVILEQENTNLKEELSAIREKTELCVPLKVIKNKICKMCLHKFEYLYRSTLSGREAKKEAITTRPCACNVI